MRLLKFISVVICLVFVNTQTAYAQFNIPEKPDFQTSVYDYINLLSGSDKKALEEKLIKYSDSTSTQIVVATISSTQGENILYLGAQWAHAWGIGQEKEDNGVFILLAHEDRKIAINTGYGVEHLLTDAMSRRIIERDIIPYFKQNDYYNGLNRGVDAIFEVLQGEYQGNSRTTTSSGLPIGLIVFLIIVFVIFLIAITKRRKGGGGGGRRFRDNDTTRDIIEAIILSKAGRGGYRRSSGGFGGFGGSGGGFGSGGFGGGFGGGGFGGGGASGGW